MNHGRAFLCITMYLFAGCPILDIRNDFPLDDHRGACR
jgi:hypothetical protein